MPFLPYVIDSPINHTAFRQTSEYTQEVGHQNVTLF